MATIAALEPDARPRERLTARGAEQLTDGELLAIVLGAGTRGASAIDVATAVLRGVGGAAGLSRATPAELAAYAGIGAVRAMLVIEALEVGSRD
jgi:DNA repair protein RadC